MFFQLVYYANQFIVNHPILSNDNHWFTGMTEVLCQSVFNNICKNIRWFSVTYHTLLL